jgi:hypothetical protein
MYVSFHIPDLIIHIMFYVFLVVVGLIAGGVAMMYILGNAFAKMLWR